MAAQCSCKGKSVPLGALWRASRFAKTRFSICFARQKEFLLFGLAWYNKIVEVNQSCKRYFI